jgi:hypothetical protein
MELGLGFLVFPFCLSSDLIFSLGLEFLFLFLDLVKELLLLEFLSLKFGLLVGDRNGTGLLLEFLLSNLVHFGELLSLLSNFSGMGSKRIDRGVGSSCC